MALPRYRSFLGIAKEATRSAGVVPTPVAPTDFIPVMNITPFDDIKYLDDENWRGSMVKTYGTAQGPIFSEFEFGGDVFVDTIGYPLAGVLGDYAIGTVVSTVYPHTMAVKNSGTGQATSYTLTDFYGRTDTNPARQYSGMQFGECGFKFNADGLLEYTAKAQGYGSAVTTLPTPSFSTEVPFASWQGAVTLGGSVTTKLVEGTLDIKRDLTPIHTVDGTQTPYQVWQGAVTCEGTMTLVLEDDTDLTRYLTNTQPSLVLDFSSGTAGTSSYRELKFTMTKAAFVVAKIERSKDFVELAVTFKAIANTTDVGASSGYSPVKVLLNNLKATAVYA